MHVNCYSVLVFECYSCGTEHRHDALRNQDPPFVWTCSRPTCGARVKITSTHNNGFSYEPISKVRRYAPG